MVDKILLFLFLSVFLTQSAFCEGIVIIGNLPREGKITLEEIKKIYLENGVRISSGQFVQPIDYYEENELRDEFYKRTFEKNRAQLKSYWARRIFTGKGTPPKSFSNTKEARTFLKSTSTPFIMYLKESDLEKNEAVILKITDSPTQ